MIPERFQWQARLRREAQSNAACATVINTVINFDSPLLSPDSPLLSPLSSLP
ncbi:hypothetical protein [Egbenema bharatensis]|uniref:hypothetical protein n=1 Tax=Egbenema bharatensis TaxID=3463334 RepID=UPI003A8BE023